tara:strand:- start:482 stop:682 length:201 start_codon:yes stop_codon:yes gene_type:complete
MTMTKLQKDMSEMSYKQAQVDLIEQIQKSRSEHLDYEDIMRILIAFKDKHNKDLAKLDKKYEGLKK